MPLMSEDETPIDPEQIPDAIKAFKQQLDALREDLKLLIRHSPQAQNDIIATANQQGTPGYDQAEVKRCREFVEKYQIRIG
jgi:hypothetical protein